LIAGLVSWYSPRITAAPGLGKSALLSQLHGELAASPHYVITPFVGATERSASAQALLERLLGELDRGGVAATAALGPQLVSCGKAMFLVPRRSLGTP